mmetsp:Transcript_7729/g.11232  ORF Transcript_7729/g.11232 Transcript_7729/m.11232 type:complete len:780 (-) Transcript_7729:360-2699(-)
MSVSNPLNPDRKKSKSSITILVLGDEGVGKSSLISTFVARHFSEVVPRVMTRVRLPPEPETQVVTTICDSTVEDATAALSTVPSNDSLTFLLSSQKQDEKRVPTKTDPNIVNNAMEPKVDCIILVYDLDRIETFYRLENHWLPMIEKYYDGEVPVIVAGNKMDLVLSTQTGIAEEQSLVRSRQQLISLLQRFRFVRQCIKCSAKNLLRVQQVFIKAQQAVLYPFSSLFDLNTGQLTHECRKAFTRIFRMYDRDNDGLLSNTELDAFQYQTFAVPLVEQDLAGWKKVISRHADEQVVKDGKFTVAGFLAIFDVFISQNRLDVPWKVLRKFGYSNSLDLAIPQEITANKFHSLSTSSRKFLAALFYQFDSDGDGILSSDDIKEIFSIVPGQPLPPWHPLRARELLKGCFSLPKNAHERQHEDNSSKNSSNQMDFSLSASGITIASAETFPTVGELQATSVSVTLPSMTFLEWMGHWHMLIAISPSAATAELFRLGHIHINNPKSKRSRTRRRERELSVYVVGSQGCGKTSLLQLLLQNDPHDTVPTTSAETSTTHYKYKLKSTDKDEKGEEMVVHFIFTEVPRDLLTKENVDPLISSLHQKVLVVFCFDTEKALLDAIKVEEELLHDDIARVFLLTKHEKDEDEISQSLYKVAQEHCCDLDLELPFFTNTFKDNTATEQQRELILKHLAQCGLQEPLIDDPALKKSKPHAEQKRREAAKRRKMIWLGGLVAVAVVGVGVLWTSVVVNKERKGRWGGWLNNFLFGRSKGTVSNGTAAQTKIE